MLNKANIALVEDETDTITATTSPVGQAVTWSTSDDAVATVADGVVTAEGAGTATITVTMTYDTKTYTDSCNVTVTAKE